MAATATGQVAAAAEIDVTATATGQVSAAAGDQKHAAEELDDQIAKDFWDEAFASEEWKIAEEFWKDSDEEDTLSSKTEAVQQERDLAEAKRLRKKELEKRLKKEQTREASFKEWADEAVKFLGVEAKQQCDVIRVGGLGVCSKCRYTHGCLRCDYPKAVRYWFKVELLQEPKLAPWELPSLSTST